MSLALLWVILPINKPLPNLSRTSAKLFEPQTKPLKSQTKPLEPQNEPQNEPLSNFSSLFNNVALLWVIFPIPNFYQTSPKPLEPQTFPKLLPNLYQTSPESPLKLPRILARLGTARLGSAHLNFLPIVLILAIWLPTWILNGVYSLFSANFCSNTFEIFSSKSWT